MIDVKTTSEVVTFSGADTIVFDRSPQNPVPLLNIPDINSSMGFDVVDDGFGNPLVTMSGFVSKLLFDINDFFHGLTHADIRGDLAANTINLQVQINQLDSDTSSHFADPDAHHFRYTDGEAISGTQSMRDALENSLCDKILTISGALQLEIDSLRQQIEGLMNATPQLVSIDLDGSTEEFNTGTSATAVPLGFSNQWSFSAWIKPGDLTSGELVLASGASIFNTFTISSTNDQELKILLRDSTGTVFKNLEYNNYVEQDLWIFVTVIFDGTDVTVYKNGSVRNPTTIFTDVSGTMLDTPRSISMGEFFQGRYHSAAFWNVALSNDEVLALHNSGNGANVDYTINAGDYISADNLVHWWRFGFVPGDIGKDFAFSGTLINTAAAAVNISIADIVQDFPTS